MKFLASGSDDRNVARQGSYEAGGSGAGSSVGSVSSSRDVSPGNIKKTSVVMSVSRCKSCSRNTNVWKAGVQKCGILEPQDNMYVVAYIEIPES